MAFLTPSFSTSQLLPYVPIIMNHLQFPECPMFSHAAMALLMMFLLPGMLFPPLIAGINLLDKYIQFSRPSSHILPWKAFLRFTSVI